VSRHELVQKSENVARNLIGLGCHRGDVISMLAQNSVDYMILAVAALRIGAISAPINSLLTPGRK